MKQENDNMFVLEEKIQETHDVMKLRFAPTTGRMFPFRPGQYVTLYFPGGKFGWQGKSYSLACVPVSGKMELAVKRIGEFSGALQDMKPGDSVKVMGPEGYFYPEPDMKRIVFLAAGIGITPFISILKELSASGELDKNDVILLYSNKTREDIAFLDLLKELSVKHPRLRVVHFITRSRIRDPDVHELCRIDGEMIGKYVEGLTDHHFFICGSIGFVNGMWETLKEGGVPEERMVTEAFY